MSATSPSRLLDRFVIRLPEGMRRDIKIRAAQNDRSANAEIVNIIKSVMSADKAASAPSA